MSSSSGAEAAEWLTPVQSTAAAARPRPTPVAHWWWLGAPAPVGPSRLARWANGLHGTGVALSCQGCSTMPAANIGNAAITQREDYTSMFVPWHRGCHQPPSRPASASRRRGAARHAAADARARGAQCAAARPPRSGRTSEGCMWHAGPPTPRGSLQPCRQRSAWQPHARGARGGVTAARIGACRTVVALCRAAPHEGPARRLVSTAALPTARPLTAACCPGSG